MSDVTLSFGAEVGDLQKGIAQVNSMMTAGLTKGLEQASRRASLSGGQIKGVFRDMGQAIAVMSALIGGAGAQIVGFAAVAATSLASVAKVLVALVGGPITITIAILAVLGGAIAGIVSHWAVFKQTVQKVWSYVVSFIAKAVEGVISLLSKIPIVGDSIARSLESVRQKAAEWRDDAEKTITTIQALEKAQKQAADTIKAMEKGFEDLAGNLKKATAELRVFGVSQRVLDANADALKGTIIDLVASGLKPESMIIQDLTKEYDEATAASKRFRVETEAQEAAVKAAADAAKKAGEAVTGRQQRLADLLAPPDTEMLVAERLAAVRDRFAAWAVEMQTPLANLKLIAMDAFQSLAQGIGDSFAAVIVAGESAKDVLNNLWKAIVGQIISSLVALGVQELIYAILSIVGATQRASAQVASYAAGGAAAAGATMAFAAAAFASQGGIPGAVAAIAMLASIPAVAAAAGAGIVAAAGVAGGAGRVVGAGVVAAEHGVSVSGPTLALIGEGRNPREHVLPHSMLEKLVDGGGGRTQVIKVYLDRRVIAEAAVRGMPEVLEIQGIRQ